MMMTETQSVQEAAHQEILRQLQKGGYVPTPSQSEAILNICEVAISRVGVDTSRAEFCHIFATAGDRQVYLNVSTRYNVEGTVGYMYPNSGSFRVGPRGGITALNPKPANKDRAARYPLIYGWR